MLEINRSRSCEIESRSARIVRALSIALLMPVAIAASLPVFANISGKEHNNGDLRVFRPSANVWYSKSQSAADSFAAVKWGLATDVLVPGDYDGDGIDDIAVWRPETGIWYILQSSDGQILYASWGMSTRHPTGSLPDVPVPADYDGDGRTDIAVWRPDTGVWYALLSGTGYDHAKALVHQWGRLGDVPVNADYDGDGRADIAVFRPWENRWYILESETQNWQVRTFGTAGYDLLVPADYSGDGRADLAIYRQGTWWVMDSSSGEVETIEFGFPDSIPVPGDYDGDGQMDLAVWRDGTWYIHDSFEPRVRTLQFGSPGDIPINSLKAKQSIVALP
jgi:hypothetical protein